ncbi:hypothetical protein [Patulibacter defluvii]|uniref:hypothetical protein n=1 Tax=Patulibacter defluvii TaxID=3095358 RepID=UPI002A758F0D|nr:hypothetical protein [Patulibacter sp. DM4]
MSRRPLAAFAALTLALAGCGGSGDDGDAYVRDWTTACRNLQVTERQLRVDVARAGAEGGSGSAARRIRRIRPAFQRYVATTSSTLRALRAVDAPDRWADYDRRADAVLGSLDQRLRQAGQALAAGDLAAIERLAGAVRSSPVPDAPEDLARRLPACRGVL